MIPRATVQRFGDGVLGAAGGGLVPRGSRVDVFQEIYWVFLALGTVVGVVVVGYMLYNAYKYREGGAGTEAAVERPTLGELPAGGGGGRKLFLSLTLSAIIVVSLIAWTYLTLLFIEQGSAAQAQQARALETDDTMVVKVVGHQFYWEFVYPNGHSTQGPLRVPEDTKVILRVTSADVMHNFGIPGLRVKTDAIPGQFTDTWFLAEDPGRFQAQCYELCGVGHSYMTADVVVMEQSAFESWYANTSDSTS